MLRYLLTVIAFLLFNTLDAQITKVQFINNSPDVANPDFDIWVDGNKVHNSLLFRNATPYININNSLPVRIGLAPANSGSFADTFFSRTITLSVIPHHVIVINGTRVATGYSPVKPIKFDVYQGGQEVAGLFGNVDLLFANGVTDGNTYDFKTDLTTLGDDIVYGTFGNGYKSMAPVKTKIRLTNSNGNIRYNTYLAELDLANVINRACVVVASGFVNPAANNNGASMGLWLAPPYGGPMIELLTTAPEPIARVQFIHNCADTTADTVDVYIDGNKIVDDFKFRHATTFMEVMGKIPTNIAIAPRNSVSAASAFYTTNFTFDSLGTHIITANGIHSATGYTPKPVFKLTKYDNAKEQAVNTTSTDVLFMQGSTDAGNVTITEFLASTWFNNIAYDNYNGYYNTTNSTTATLRSSVSGAWEFYQLNIGTENLQGSAITLVNSGFLDSTKNSKGPQIWLYAAKASGGALIKLPKTHIGIQQIEHGNDFSLYPNPASTKLYLKTDEKIYSATIYSISGVTIKEQLVTDNMVNIEDITSGTYFIQLHKADGNFTKSFIKQ